MQVLGHDVAALGRRELFALRAEWECSSKRRALRPTSMCSRTSAFPVREQQGWRNRSCAAGADELEAVGLREPKG